MFFQAEDGIRDVERSRGLGDVYKRQHQSLDLNSPQGRLTVRFDIVPDDEHPYAVLSAYDEMGERLAEKRVQASFKFNRSSAQAWMEGDF